MQPSTSHISAELVRRAQVRNLCPDAVATLDILGAAIDAGLISLDALLDLVRSCSTADELGDALAMVATTATVDPLPVGCPPGHEHRVFRIVGEREGGA